MKIRRALVAAAIAALVTLATTIGGGIFAAFYRNSETLTDPSGNGGIAVTAGIFYLLAIIAGIVSVAFLIRALVLWAKDDNVERS